ncbi:MAG: hypothetical protein ACYDHD_10450 [Vulcanimicrobiaceae bacterium]
MGFTTPAERVLPAIRAREFHPVERIDRSPAGVARMQPHTCEDRLATTALRFSEDAPFLSP